MSIKAQLGGRPSLNATLVTQSVNSIAPIRLASVVLLASNWEGSESPYTQIVTIEGVTERSKVDLQPSVAQLEIFHDKDIAFSTENDDGVVTVFAVGDKPTQDYTIQATVTEVAL